MRRSYFIVKWGKTMRKKLTVCCTAFLLALSLTVPALAASGAFQDVPETADCYESVM